jgi:hypothetical protein
MPISSMMTDGLVTSLPDRVMPDVQVLVRGLNRMPSQY